MHYVLCKNVSASVEAVAITTVSFTGDIMKGLLLGSKELISHQASLRLQHRSGAHG